MPCHRSASNGPEAATRRWPPTARRRSVVRWTTRTGRCRPHPQQRLCRVERVVIGGPLSRILSMAHERKVAIVGLGYVGLPVAVAFARTGQPVIAFDIDRQRIEDLRDGYDRTREVASADLQRPELCYTNDPADLAQADFFIITVPTPIDSAKRPDLRALLSASRTVGGALARGSIVVYQSTVYPGATENECMPVLEQVSGLRYGTDFSVGYSPERINPGDQTHPFETIPKIV